MAKIESSSVILGTETRGGIIGKTLEGRVWEDLTGEPNGAVRVSYCGGCSIYVAERRSDGAYQVEGRNWCAMFDEGMMAARDTGPREWAAYGGTTWNLPENWEEIVCDLKREAYGQ